MRILITESQYKHLLRLINEDAVSITPKKAELVKDDLSDFYKTLNSAAEKGGLKQQSSGSMTYQKEVESLQIGLILLGYNLPKYGVDGLFGPETAQAVDKFTKENVKSGSKVGISEATTALGPFRGDLENGPSNHAKRGFGNWQSDNAWDLFASPGTVVNSYTVGTVRRVKHSSKRSGKVYGTQVTVRGENGYPDIFYTHLKNVNVSTGDKVNVGDPIGEVSEWNDWPKGSHVHIGLPKGNHIKDLLVNSDAIFTGSGKLSPIRPSGDEESGQEEMSGGKYTKATPEMILKLIEMLKAKKITASDIKNYVGSDYSVGVSDGPTITGNVILKGPFNGEQSRNISLLIAEMEKNGIKNPYTQVGILSVIGKESGFRPIPETVKSYGGVSSVRKIFGNRVAKYSDEELEKLIKNEKEFFKVVYAGSIGNQGGEHGWMYRGRGFNQLTGIKNYEKYGRMIGMGDELVKNPELVNDIKIAVKIALAFFTKGKPASSLPNFNNVEDAATYFADINAGGRSERARKSSLATSKKFGVKSSEMV